MNTIHQKIRTFIIDINHPTPPDIFSLSDILLLIFFLFAGFLSRTFRLSFPPNRVFDEIHFGNFINHYILKSYFHDIHPPLGKLLIALYAYMVGYDGKINFKGNEYPNLFYFSLRQVPSTFSALLPPVSFISLRFFGFSSSASILIAFYLTFESMLIVESHLILVDGILHSFVVLTILGVSLLEIDQYSRFAIIFTILMAGATFSVKYTGLSILVFIGMHQLIYFSKSSFCHLFNLDNTIKKKFDIPLIRLIIRMMIIITFSFLVMYLTFVIHIIILPYHGPGDSFMPRAFTSTLLSKGISSNSSARTCCMPMHQRVFTLMKSMHESNMRIKKPHSAASKWYDWPLARMKCLPYFTKVYSLILVPSLIIWYTAAFGPVMAIILAMLGYFYGNSGLTKLIIWPAGYYASLIPFALIPRVLFVYHYLIPLIFGCFSFVTSMDVIFSGNRQLRTCVFVLLIVFCFIFYVFYAPWIYAMKGYDWNIRYWKSKMF